jgi:hypothetical protein
MAIALAEGGGGGLFGEDTTFDGEARATITLKVLPTKFRQLLTDLGKLGAPEAQQVKTDDVTQQVIDLDARLSVAQEGLDRMRGLLTKASNLSDVATLESDVQRRQTEVEQLRGEQQTLSQRVDLATVILTIHGGGAIAAVSSPSTTTTTAPAVAPTLPGFTDGLQGGWKVFVNVGTVVLAGVGAALPFLPFVVIGLVAWRIGRRRRPRADPLSTES